MPLAIPPTISNQADQIQKVLSPWATAAGGIAEVVSNLQMMWNQASMSPSVPRVLICYNGETIRGEFAVANLNRRVDRQWIVAVTRGRGWNSNRGDSLYKTVGNSDPFYDVVEEVRDLLRTMVGISEEFPVDFKSISPMTSGNKTLDSYAIQFSTANDLSWITLTDQNAPASP